MGRNSIATAVAVLLAACATPGHQQGRLLSGLRHVMIHLPPPAFEGEPLPERGEITLTDRPGWGLEPNYDGVTWRRPFPVE